MKIIIIFLVVITLMSTSIKALSQEKNSIEFIENKGQWDKEILYKAEMSNGVFFLTKTGFTVVQHNSKDLEKISELTHGSSYKSSNGNLQNSISESITLHSHAYKVDFVNAGKPVTVAENSSDSYSNYFIGNDPSKWTSNCKTFREVTYRNIYPDVDVKYYTENNSLKYDIIAKPGADINRIAMKYDGVNNLTLKNDELLVTTSVSEVKDMAPYTYQTFNGNKKDVSCKFDVKENIVTFKVGDHQKNVPLIIDPVLVFSTFTGSTADNWGYTATYGSDGSFYAAGLVFATGFPTNVGAYNTNYNGGASDEEGIGGYDMGIIKFSPDGSNRIYATYLGGSGNESPVSMITDAQGNLIIAARTYSPNYPTTAPLVGIGGGYDIVITKLNAAGSALIGSRKIGGSGRDGINVGLKYALPRGAQSIRRNYDDDARSEVMLDNNDNIILVSNTQSSDFPTTTNAFQKNLGGKQDGVIIKTSADLSTILFTTFIGGSEDDGAFNLAINPSTNNIYVSGSTVSANLPGDKTSAINPSFQGGICDGFVSIISSDGSSIIKTTYLGTSSADMVYGIKFDKSNFPYVMGTTTGSWPVINAAFSQPGGKQFISKLKADLSAYEYSTVYGTNDVSPNISPTAFFVDACENVYVSGWGGVINTSPGASYPNAGTNGLTVTSNAIQSTTDGSDFYFFVLSKNSNAQLYGSFFGQNSTGTAGGEHVDGGTSRFDNQGILYQAICANCGRTATFPTTPGAWSTTNGSRDCNLAAVKVAFNLCAAALPIHLLNFAGQVNNNFHELSWQISNEEAGDTYFLEKKTSANADFTTTYTTRATLDNSNNTYRIKVPAAGNPETFYRLKIISVNGQVSYSSIVMLMEKNLKVLKVSLSGSNLVVNVPDDASLVALYTSDGKLLYKQNIAAGTGRFTIPMTKIAHGTIVVKVQLKDNVITNKVVY